MEISVVCGYCEGGKLLLRFERPSNQTEDQFRAAWKVAVTSGPNGGTTYESIDCGSCGAAYQIVDDGVPYEEGGFVEQKNVSKPGIDLVTISAGPATGGNMLYIEGSALEHGNLVVKFGGKPSVYVVDRSVTRAAVKVPPGQYRLNVAERISGAFIVGEEVRGATSGARGVVKDADRFIIENPNKPFVADEVDEGLASGAQVKLGSPPYSGAVTVSVENEYGQRAVGGAIVDGYTYE